MSENTAINNVSAASIISANPLRIVHVVSSLQFGGMEKFVLRIAAAQRGAGHDAAVFALRGGPLENEAATLRIPCHILQNPSAVQRILQTISFYRKFRPQIVHSHNTTSLHYASLAKLTCGSKVVITLHGQGGGSGRPIGYMERFSKDAEIACSQEVANLAAGYISPKHMHVIRNGVEFTPSVREREATRKDLGLLNDDIVGVMVARMDGLKGHDTLLQATAVLGNAAPTFLLAGDGARKKELQDLAAELHIADNRVRFLGFRQDVPDLLAAADFFVLPSFTEGLPLSILEAMSHRLPIVATNVGGIPELVKDGEHGFLVPPKEPEALANAITRLVDNPDLRVKMGEAGYKRVAKDFSFRRMTEEYEKVYFEELGDRKRI